MTKDEINEEACEHCNQVMCSVCENRTCDNTHLATLKCREWRDRRAGYYCGAESRENHITELEKENEKLKKRLSVLLSCKNCPDNKGGFICQKEYEGKCLTQKIQYIKELKEENTELEKENAELNKKLSKAEADYDKMFWNKNEIISKAKELLRMVIDSYNHKERFSFEKDLIKAEQFLNSEVEK